jgi:hypothetical protein
MCKCERASTIGNGRRNQKEWPQVAARRDVQKMAVTQADQGSVKSLSGTLRLDICCREILNFSRPKVFFNQLSRHLAAQ